MEDGYEFNPTDIPNITLKLLIDFVALQQASLSVIMEHMDLPELEKKRNY